MTRLLRRMLLAPTCLLPICVQHRGCGIAIRPRLTCRRMIPHDTRNVRSMMCVALGEARTRLHSVAARQDLRGTRLPLLFYCNRKPPLSASGQHRFTKHPAPIFKKKALHNHLTPPSILRKLAFLNRWGRGKFVKKLYKKEPSPIVKFLISGCKKLIRTPPSPPSSLNAPPRSCPSQMPLPHSPP